MEDGIYRRLRDQLDQYAVGFPVSESEMEIEILKHLFTSEEAETFLFLGLKPETVESISTRVGRDTHLVLSLLNRMFDKGLVLRLRKGGTMKFAALPFAPGIYEQQSGTMDGALASLFDGYFKEVFHRNFTQTEPVLIHRPIPINRVVDVSYPTPIYENSREIVKAQDLIAVTNCICRVQKGALDRSCGKPVETCLMFGSQARFYIERGTGRRIKVDEALEILDRCEDAGLVTMPFNSQTPANICNCCPDCCVVLRALKMHPRPAEMIKPTFYAALDLGKCEGCETCLENCPMDAISLGKDNIVDIRMERCIGCGLCVTVCPNDAIQLKPRPENERFEPPQTTVETFVEIGKRRRESVGALAT